MGLAAATACVWAQSPTAWIALVQGDVGIAQGANGAMRAWQGQRLGDNDALWTGPGGYASVNVAPGTLRVGPNTRLEMTRLGAQLTQLRLTQGSVELRLAALGAGQQVQVDTPNLAFVSAQPGAHALQFDAASDTTRIDSTTGGGVIYSPGGQALAWAGPRQGSFSGTALATAVPLTLAPQRAANSGAWPAQPHALAPGAAHSLAARQRALADQQRLEHARAWKHSQHQHQQHQHDEPPPLPDQDSLARQRVNEMREQMQARREQTQAMNANTKIRQAQARAHHGESADAGRRDGSGHGPCRGAASNASSSNSCGRH